MRGVYVESCMAGTWTYGIHFIPEEEDNIFLRSVSTCKPMRCYYPLHRRENLKSNMVYSDIFRRI
jgi:hypothetical protein